MSDLLTKSLSSFSYAAFILASGIAGAADLPSFDSIDSQASRQFVQEQDQTQFHNRQRLEQRINGSGDGTAAKNRNRYRYQEQTRSRSQISAGGGQWGYHGASGLASGGQGASGRRMSGGGRR